MIPRGILTSVLLPVQVDWRGSVPAGNRLSNYSLAPEVVTVSGDPNVLRNIKVVHTEPLRLNQYSRNATVKVKVVPIQGATVEPAVIRVSLQIVAVR
ncbi:MAG: hypothetical protein C4341_06070 [Armatimonadota bacterium]